MTEDLKKVRYRNDGDDFHVLWAARRCLRILDCRNDLVAVSIEGISERERALSTKGLLVVDMAEYFGGEQIDQARQVVYSQLKHSTTSPNAMWTAGEIKDVIVGFSERFRVLVGQYGATEILAKVRFQFFTNRPISENIFKAINATFAGSEARLKGHARNAYLTIKKSYGSDDGLFSEFLTTLDFSGEQKNRVEQEAALAGDVHSFAASRDLNVQMCLTKLVYQNTLSDSVADPTIRKENLLVALNISEDELYPAPPRFEECEEVFSRTQESEIAEQIYNAQTTIVIHASGGVGKSVMANRLPELMPAGSVSVIFDGFAGGEYRRDRIPRHEHRYGIVQIINELSGKGLCDPLLPVVGTQPSQYFNVFRQRVQQAVESVRRSRPGSIVLIILDAADNSVMAANDRQERAFVLGLLQENPPEGCRIVAMARTERLELLALRQDCCKILLNAFCRDESRKHLHKKYPDANDNAVDIFHRLTSQNPRTQSYVLQLSKNLNELMEILGPSARSVDDVICNQVETSLEKARVHATNPCDIDQLCFALAFLPPMVPIAVLAHAANIPDAAVISFASDMGHPFLVKDGALQFRDEPVETWFRETYDRDATGYKDLAVRLRPLAETDPYVAAVLPRILYCAGEFAELLQLALEHNAPDNEGVIARRDIILRRVQYAMKAMLSENRVRDVMCLLLRASEELASKDRQGEFLLNHATLVSALNDTQFLVDMVFRKHVNQWRGSNLVHRALMLSVNEDCRPEAFGFLRQANVWLREWSRTSVDEDDHEREGINNKDIIAFILTAHHLRGENSAIRELRRWLPLDNRFDHGALLIHELIDLYGKNCALKLVNNSRFPANSLLGATVELNAVGVLLPTKVAKHLALILLRHGRLVRHDGEPKQHVNVLSVICLAEALANQGQKRLAINCLEQHRPGLIDYLSISDDKPEVILRWHSLYVALKRKDLTTDDLLPKKDEIDHSRSDSRRDLEEYYQPLLPWYLLQARLLSGRLSACKVEMVIADLSAKRRSSYENRRPGFTRIEQNIGMIWFSCLTHAGILNEDRIQVIRQWLLASECMVFIPTWTSLARMATHQKISSEQVISFAHEAIILIEREHMTASDTADAYAKLSAAMLCCDKVEAGLLLERGFEVLDKIDMEARARLDLACELAWKTGKNIQGTAEDAYNLSRVAELIHKYDDHKFPWTNMASAIAELHPPSVFTILGRWQDRNVGWFDENLPVALKTLLYKGVINSEVLIAFNSVGMYWRYENVIQFLLQKNPHVFDDGAFRELLLRDIEINQDTIHVSPDVRGQLAQHGIESRWIREKEPEEEYVPSVRVSRVAPDNKDSEPVIPDGADLTSPAVIDQIMSRNHRRRNFTSWGQLFSIIRSKVPLEQRDAHITSLAYLKEPHEDAVVDALKAAFVDWGKSLRTQKAVKSATRTLLDVRIIDLATPRYRMHERIGLLAELTGMEEPDVITHLLTGIIDHLEEFSTSDVIRFVEKYLRYLDSSDALEILRYVTKQFDTQVRDDDGDGNWELQFAPPESLPKSMAGLLWSLLGSPQSELRWKTAHTLRRLAFLGQCSIVDAVIGFFENDNPQKYTDSRLPFFYMHAQLYLLIALARIAEETPDVLLKHSGWLSEVALKQSHIQIRHFARQAALSLEKYQSGTYEAQVLRDLTNVNMSQHAPVEDPEERTHGRGKWRSRKDSRYLFHMDLSDGWFSSLARTFADTTVDDIETMAASTILDEWEITDSTGAWTEDPRNSLGIHNSSYGSVSKYSYPAYDDYSFYLSLHAMMVVAGKLLATKPIAVDRWSDVNWPDWMKDHILTCDDGTWIADYRDPNPLNTPDITKAEYSKNWEWSVTQDDIDGSLFSSADKQIVVGWGNWTTHNNGQEEDVRINSALVSPENSLSLLSALQTCERFSDYCIPWAGSDMSIIRNPFFMKGWITLHDREKHLDGLDPLSGAIYYPPNAPRPGIMRMFELEESKDKRTWKTSDGMTVMNSEVWGEWRDEHRGSHSQYGERITMSMNFMLRMLSRLNKDMIVEVQIRRKQERYSRDSYGYLEPYCKLYVLKKDGMLYDFYGSSKIG